MKINKETKLWDVIKAFNWKWCVVTLKNGKRIKLYIVDVDYEAFGYNIIVYNILVVILMVMIFHLAI